MCIKLLKTPKLIFDSIHYDFIEQWHWIMKSAADKFNFFLRIVKNFVLANFNPFSKVLPWKKLNSFLVSRLPKVFLNISFTVRTSFWWVLYVHYPTLKVRYKHPNQRSYVCLASNYIPTVNIKLFYRVEWRISVVIFTTSSLYFNPKRWQCKHD